MTPVSTPPQLRTPGVIARELGESLQRVQYILRTRPHIRPAALAGRLRLYDREAVAMVHANGVGRAVQVGGGAHRVEMRFAAHDLNAGLGVSAFAWLLWLTWLLRQLWLRRSSLRLRPPLPNRPVIIAPLSELAAPTSDPAASSDRASAR